MFTNPGKPDPRMMGGAFGFGPGGGIANLAHQAMANGQQQPGQMQPQVMPYPGHSQGIAPQGFGQAVMPGNRMHPGFGGGLFGGQWRERFQPGGFGQFAQGEPWVR